MAIRAIIFDIGGVLLRTLASSDSHTGATRFTSKEQDIYKFIRTSGLGHAATTGQLPSRDLFQAIAAKFGLNEQQVKDFENNFVTDERLNTELAQFIMSLRPHYQTATLSNAWSGTREAICHKYGLAKFVDTMIFSYEEGMAKPDPRLYALTLSRLNIEPGESLFVDDKRTNVTAARETGIHAIHYKGDTMQAIHTIQQYLQKE